MENLKKKKITFFSPVQEFVLYTQILALSAEKEEKCIYKNKFLGKTQKKADHFFYTSHAMRKFVFGSLRPGQTENRPAQPQKLARVLKFRL